MNKPSKTEKSDESLHSLKEELVLTENEFGLFELMRDQVILDLKFVTVGSPVINSAWVCTYQFAYEKAQTITSYGSALDAFMRARIEIITAKIEGKQVYSEQAQKKRKELGLS